MKMVGTEKASGITRLDLEGGEEGKEKRESEGGMLIGKSRRWGEDDSNIVGKEKEGGIREGKEK